jgi:hypothetical protein
MLIRRALNCAFEKKIVANFKLVLLNVIGKTEVKNKETTVQDVGLEDEI